MDDTVKLAVAQERIEILHRVCKVNLLCEDMVGAIFGWGGEAEEEPEDDKEEEPERKQMKARQILTTKQKRNLVDPERVVELFKDGISKTEIARRMGASESTIHRHLKNAGCVGRVTKTEIDEGKVIALRRAKPPRSAALIARDMRISEEEVVQILKKNDLWEVEHAVG